jgi:hypothetical protein
MTSPLRGIVICLCLGSLTSGASGLSRHAQDVLLQQFLSHTDVALESYTARRSMHARNTRFKKEAWLEAITGLDPVSGFTYEVVASSGSSLVINRVLLPALRGEAQMWRDGDPQRSALTLDNYEFPSAEPVLDAVPGEIRIPVRPRRRHVLLVDGALFLSPGDADLIRVEGRLSKSPSFWVSRVDVVRRYARIAGVRVPVELHSAAHVRIAGRSDMRIVYRYESINGRLLAGIDVPPETRDAP